MKNNLNPTYTIETFQVFLVNTKKIPMFFVPTSTKEFQKPFFETKNKKKTNLSVQLFRRFAATGF